MADEDTREFLRGVLLEFNRNQLRAVATNDHHLAIAHADATTNVNALQHIIAPRDDVYNLTDWLRRMFRKSVNVIVQDNVLCLSLGDAEVRAPLVFGSYPNYRDVVPNHTRSFVVDCSSLLALLDEACDKSETATFKVSLSKAALSLSKDSGHEAQLNVDYDGDSIETGLDSIYPGNILRAIQCDRVRIAVKGREHPWRFESEQDESATYVLMPVKVWDLGSE
jgi:DNA polymerase-3 subunit beta